MEIASVEAAVATFLRACLPGHTVLRGLDNEEIPPYRQIILAEVTDSLHTAGPLHEVTLSVRVESPVMQFSGDDHATLAEIVGDRLNAYLPALMIASAIEGLILHGTWLIGREPYREDGRMGTGIQIRLAIEESPSITAIASQEALSEVIEALDETSELGRDCYLVDTRGQARMIEHPAGTLIVSGLFGGLAETTVAVVESANVFTVTLGRINVVAILAPGRPRLRVSRV